MSSCATCGFDGLGNYPRCPVCEGRRNREKVDRLAEVIVGIKANPPGNPEAERRVIKQLRELDHPNPNEFVAAVCRRDRK